LDVLSSPEQSSFHGAYQGFLYELELSQFDASSNRLAGLDWALTTLERDRYCRTHRIACLIVLGSIEAFDNPDVVKLFAQYVLEAEKAHIDPFPERSGNRATGHEFVRVARTCLSCR